MMRGPRKKDYRPEFPGKVLSPDEIENIRHLYEPPLTREEIIAKQSTPSPDRSHWKDRK